MWPLAAVTDSWTYLAPADVDVDDTLPYLGKYTIEKRSPLDADGLLSLLACTSAAQTRKAIGAIHRAHAAAARPVSDADDGAELATATAGES